MKKTISILFLFPVLCFAQWTQLGNHIEGTQSSGNLGQSVSINGTGQIISVGVPNKTNSTGNNTGQVQVYELQGANWTPKGNPINGINSGDKFGLTQELSDNGTVVAIGAPGFLTNPATSGYMRVYEFNGTDWVQRGSDLLGDTPNDSYGTEISLSADGSIVAVAAEPFITASYIRVFQWNGIAWSQLGIDISTGIAGDAFGRSISLSADGMTLIAGAVNHDSPSTDIGRAIVFEWNGTNWVQKGTDLIGDEEDDFFGAGVAINDNGTTIVVGARDNVFNMSRGYVKIFEWNGSNWMQKGSNLIGEQGGDFFGDVNDINNTGDIIISGSVLGNFAKIHEFQGTDWVELDRISVAGAGQFGTAVGMNNSGSRTIIGDFSNLVGGLNGAGRATVFENNSLSIGDVDQELKLNVFPNPSSSFVYVESKQNIQWYNIVSINGKLVKHQIITNQKNFTIDLRNISDGMYILKLVSDTKTKSIKLIKK
ncbi:putative secreted protein (Por secretion system target) [Kordia periserrulae]|uniref:Putative secreted protein (Por secretion system target) n=1 Tax=Kordia periserrulae TaxID=701523 RepID=A0A2T6BSE5_9FLAO|nr:T9SS type A sorting domain-containing protein [Kordia periserrulae]PTX58969.1 putative secreted protein (Por secretion system target) [Kordia periserrulae]